MTRLLAIWLALHFTVPPARPDAAAVVRYECLGRDQLGYEWSPTLYAAPNPGAGRPLPGGPGDTVRVWLSHSLDGRPRWYRIVQVGADSSRSGKSNPVVFVAGLARDTLMCCPEGRNWKRTPGGSAYWNLGMPFADDDRFQALLWDELQFQDRATICQHCPGLTIDNRPGWFYQGAMRPCP